MTFGEMRLTCSDFTEQAAQRLKEKMPMALEKAKGLGFNP